MGHSLGEFEQLILLALVRLGPEAYGVTILREIEQRTGRRVAIGAVYTSLARLEKKGYVSNHIGEPTPERGGRRKKFYQLEPAGARALSQSFAALTAMIDDASPTPAAGGLRRKGDERLTQHHKQASPPGALAGGAPGARRRTRIPAGRHG